MLNASYTSILYGLSRPRNSLTRTNAASAMNSRDLSGLAVVVPNLHWRYSGVTATNRMVAPRLMAQIRAAWLGPDAPSGITRLTVGDLLRLRARSERATPRVWHARRNNE